MNGQQQTWIQTTKRGQVIKISTLEGTDKIYNILPVHSHALVNICIIITQSGCSMVIGLLDKV